MKELIRLEDISKSFSGVQALSDVNINLYEGEVHVLLGENGAGKSTLMKVLTGIYQPDSGSIYYEGKQVHLQNPKQAEQLGIDIIHQEFNLLLHQTVATNIFLGNEPLKGRGMIDYRKRYEESKRVLEDLEVDIDPNALVLDLGVGERQIVEIAKAVSHNAKVLIMDEPTAALTTNEIEKLFRMVDKLLKRNVGIFYISHRMDEIFKVCDRVSVMRDGKYIRTDNTADITVHDLIASMVGRELGEDYPQRTKPIGEVVLEVENLESEKVHGVTFQLHKGEILGFGGLVGAGRTEVMQAIFGADRVTGGTISIKGKTVSVKSPSRALELGIGLIPEDRKNQGVLLGLSVRQNVTFSSLKQAMIGCFVSNRKDVAIATEYTEKLRIKTPSVNQQVKNLSGGNQQKVVLAKALATKCDIIIFDEPTRGIDVGAKQEIYGLMRHLADEEGKSIIMVSSEMPELIGMSDRILVMRHGGIVGEIQKENYSQELILEYASGLK